MECRDKTSGCKCLNCVLMKSDGCAHFKSTHMCDKCDWNGPTKMCPNQIPNGKTIEMKKVNSSNIQSIGYDEDTTTVYVKFWSGTTYAYKGVTSDAYGLLYSATSVGSYFNANIKNAYPWRKLDKEESPE